MTIVNVIIQGPFWQGFDYLADVHPLPRIQPGIRVKVPFRNKPVIGLVQAISESSNLPTHRLLKIIEILDETPVFTPPIWQLGKWASRYYQHYPGDTLFTMLPGLLRKGESSQPDTLPTWGITPEGIEALHTPQKRAPRQHTLLKLLASHPEGLGQDCLQERSKNMPVLKRLLQKKQVWKKNVLANPCNLHTVHNDRNAAPPYPLTPPQHTAITMIQQHSGYFHCFCLDGVTGSGKTEVYIQTIRHCLQTKKQALMLVPEITLTQQLIARFEARFPGQIAISHSAMTNTQRLQSWKAMRDGGKTILIGTRSAVFTPLQQPGLIIIDEEHDASYKQQEGLRYHARDLAVVRAKNENIPVVLGSATPSAETLHNALQQRYMHLQLPQRVATSITPNIRMIDIKTQAMQHGMSHALVQTLRQHLQAGGQVLLFLNRRGYAPVLMCTQCQWKARCHHCEAQLVTHRYIQKLCCHHCGYQTRIPSHCPQCNTQDLLHLGQGTERLEEALQTLFPTYPVVRIDRDSTRHKGSLETLLEKIHTGTAKILLGTQMLAKGHHFPDVTLAAILNADQGLFSADFRSIERVTQLITQVAGRAGRATKTGEIIIQTSEPDHPVLKLLLQKGYHACLQQTLQERKQARLPPFSAMALLRAEAQQKELPNQFLSQIKTTAIQLTKKHVANTHTFVILGPIPALLEKRAGFFGWQLLLQCSQRAILQQFMHVLRPHMEKHPLAKKLRWSIDIDPIDMG